MIYFSNNIDQRLYRQDAGGRRARPRRLQPEPLWMRSGTQMALSTAGGDARFASERTHWGRRGDHDTSPQLTSPAQPQLGLVSGNDFYSRP